MMKTGIMCILAIAALLGLMYVIIVVKGDEDD